MRTTTQHTIVTRGLLALLVATLLAACGGGGGDDDQVATLGTDEGAAADEDGGAGDDEVTDEEREDAMLAFTECMRDKGIDMPDPQTSSASGGGGAVRGPLVIRGEPKGGGTADQEAFEEAHEECFPLMEDVVGEAPDMDPEEQAERQDNALAYAKCMREHGIDFPDPEFSEGGMAMRLPDGMDPSDPEFSEAEEACQPELGFEKGEGPTTHIEGSGPGGGPASASASAS
jgi:hypothetical protein